MMTDFTPQSYQQQLDDKTVKLQQLLAEFDLPDIAIYKSPIKHYRMRAEFRIWHEGNELYHVMFDSINKRRIRIDQFPVASTLINQAMLAIIPLLQKEDLLRNKLFQIDYLSTLSGQLLISLIYHKKLDESDWRLKANDLRQQLIQQGFNVNIVGRSSGQKICLDTDYIEEKITVLGRDYIYRQVENSFTQPNASVNIKMLEWVVNSTKNLTGDLLEFYCGNGNFSIVLAQNFHQVLATEIAKASVCAAQYNISINHIDNLKIVRLSAEELTQALKGARDFKRLKDINLSDYQCETVLVDPPRSGLDDNTIDIIQHYKNIIYISCNPITLKDNLKKLKNTHRIAQVALFDQFPYTDHAECGIILRRV